MFVHIFGTFVTGTVTNITTIDNNTVEPVYNELVGTSS